MSVPRLLHSATTLATGKVLVAGGCQGGNLVDCVHPHASAETFDPLTGKWSSAAPMPDARVEHTATLLADGRVLVVGGHSICRVASCAILSSADLYDPDKNAWESLREMGQHRLGHTATLLLNGQLLVAGGCPFLGPGRGCDGTATAELFDPATGIWTPTGFMRMGRTFATATLLPTGQVLVAGGVDSTSLPSANAEVFDPTTRTWTAVSSMRSPRYLHTATLLRSGKVLVAGGGARDTETFDPISGAWEFAGPQRVPRANHTATLLGSGQVLVAGGHDSSNTPLASAELFSPAIRRWLY
jgi:hypothetical protein